MSWYKENAPFVKTNTFYLYIFANLFILPPHSSLLFIKSISDLIFFHYTIHCGLKYNFLIIASSSLDDNNSNKKVRSLKIALCKGSSKYLITIDVFLAVVLLAILKTNFSVTLLPSSRRDV